ncbi:MAG TPA: PIN domain-containing protein [Thermoanaerobaculia bacterium]|nr:PIN domain-containing protein [Thermoanaerobaculia bacterium]
MIAIDTNLLVYAHRSAAPENERARSAIERASADSRGWGISLASIAEFWTVVTHAPLVSGPPSTPREARRFLSALLDEAGGRLWMPREAFWERLVETADDLGIRGPRIFDLQIGLTAIDNGAVEIWTHDAGFVSVPGLRVHDPL